MRRMVKNRYPGFTNASDLINHLVDIDESCIFNKIQATAGLDQFNRIRLGRKTKTGAEAKYR